MRVLVIAVVAVVAAGLGGCATLDEGECLAGNWDEIGFVDGVDGYPMSRLSQHADACAEYGVVPALASYAAGRDRGLRSYCTVEIGFFEGRTGDSYQGVCPPGLEDDFLAGFADGELVWAMQRRIEFAREAYRNARNRAERLTNDMAADENRLADENLTNEERASIGVRLNRLQDERERAYADMRRAEREEDFAERDLIGLRVRLVGFYGPW